MHKFTKAQIRLAAQVAKDKEHAKLQPFAIEGHPEWLWGGSFGVRSNVLPPVRKMEGLALHETVADILAGFSRGGTMPIHQAGSDITSDYARGMVRRYKGDRDVAVFDARLAQLLDGLDVTGKGGDKDPIYGSHEGRLMAAILPWAGPSTREKSQLWESPDLATRILEACRAATSAHTVDWLPSRREEVRDLETYATNQVHVNQRWIAKQAFLAREIRAAILGCAAPPTYLHSADAPKPTPRSPFATYFYQAICKSLDAGVRKEYYEQKRKEGKRI